ncbi:MAG TPA: EamA family transporter [Candidatus Nanoarchaeia archaeon]|nr:EamA family transporter [Candidatus Nanoarchaeia archaeon]
MGLSWFFFIMLAVIFWSVAAVIVKFIRIKFMRHPFSYMVITAPVCFFVLLLLFFGKVDFPDAEVLLFIALSALSAFLGYWLYLTALRKEDVSTIVTLMGIQPLIVLIFATVFLGETLSLKHYIAFPLMMVGSMALSIKKVDKRFICTSGILITLVSAILYSLNSVFIKAIQQTDFITLNVLRQLAWLIFACAIFASSGTIRAHVKETVKAMGKKNLVLAYVAEFLGFSGMIFAIVAIQKGPVSLVTLTSSLEGLFVIILAALVSLFIPRFIKENIDKKTICLKIFSALLMLTGIALVV